MSLWFCLLRILVTLNVGSYAFYFKIHLVIMGYKIRKLKLWYKAAIIALLILDFQLVAYSTALDYWRSRLTILPIFLLCPVWLAAATLGFPWASRIMHRLSNTAIICVCVCPLQTQRPIILGSGYFSFWLALTRGKFLSWWGPTLEVTRVS